MNTKAQGISINTIIIAAIGLAVLVVLFAIFTGRLGGFTQGVQDTDTCAHKCASLNQNPGTAPTESKTCASGDYVAGRYKDGANGCCCIPKA